MFVCHVMIQLSRTLCLLSAEIIITSGREHTSSVFCQSDNLWIRSEEPQFSPEGPNVRVFPVFVQLALVGPNGTAAKRINQRGVTESVNGRVTCQETDWHPAGTSALLYITLPLIVSCSSALSQLRGSADAWRMLDINRTRVTCHGLTCLSNLCVDAPSPQTDEDNTVFCQLQLTRLWTHSTHLWGIQWPLGCKHGRTDL